MLINTLSSTIIKEAQGFAAWYKLVPINDSNINWGTVTNTFNKDSSFVNPQVRCIRNAYFGDVYREVPYSWCLFEMRFSILMQSKCFWCATAAVKNNQTRLHISITNQLLFKDIVTNKKRSSNQYKGRSCKRIVLVNWVFPSNLTQSYKFGCKWPPFKCALMG